MNVLIRRKPILMAEGSEWLDKRDYKYRRKAYAGYIELYFYTDLSRREFYRLLDGKYNRIQIEKFELTGRF